MTLIALLLFGALQQAGRDDQCISCHEDQGRDVRNTMHQQAGVDCVSCHGTDEVVKEKHKYLPTFRPGRVHQIAALCATCHSGVADDFKESEHAELPPGNDIAANKRSTCYACHDSHVMPPARRTEILKACLKCHEEGSHEFREALDVYWEVDEFEGSLRQFNIALDRARGAAGILVGDLEVAQHQAEAARTRCRSVQHSLKWNRVKESAAAGKRVAEEGTATLAGREKEFGRRFTGLVVFLGLLGLSAALVVYRAKRVV